MASLDVGHAIGTVETARRCEAVDKGSGVVYTAFTRMPVESAHCGWTLFGVPRALRRRGRPLDPVVAVAPRAVIEQVDVACDLE